VTDSYSLKIKRSAEKELRAVPKKDLPRVIERIQSLAVNPRAPGHQKLSGHDQYRIRQGDYRILYTINDTDRVVEIIKIGHRREVYR
jgi:mRNA interferase RelE/StbE